LSIGSKEHFSLLDEIAINGKVHYLRGFGSFQHFEFAKSHVEWTSLQRTILLADDNNVKASTESRLGSKGLEESDTYWVDAQDFIEHV
jgi:hypothetical protein